MARAAVGRSWQVTACSHSDIDIQDAAVVDSALDGQDVVVNAAAYTAVDMAESEPERAFDVNSKAAETVGRLCARRGLPLIHFSTDYVFDGEQSQPYIEDSATHPLGVYARSKLAGEQAVLAAGGRGLVLRTSWVYAAHGHNFVRTMLRLGRERDHLRVVNDQFGCPTSAAALADATVAVIVNLTERDLPHRLYHLAGSGAASWYEFAVEIFDTWRELTGTDVPVVEPVPSEAYPTPSPRPRYTVLDCARLERDCGIRLPAWQESLRVVIEQLVSARAPTC